MKEGKKEGRKERRKEREKGRRGAGNIETGGKVENKAGYTTNRCGYQGSHKILITSNHIQLRFVNAFQGISYFYSLY